MSTLLYRLGHLAYRRRGRVLLLWLLVLVGVGTAVALNPPQTSTEFRIAGTASQDVLDQLATELPSSSGSSARIVFEAPDGQRVDTPQRTAAIADAVDAIHASPYVVPVDTGSGGAAPSEAMQKAMAPVGDVTVAPLNGADGSPVPGVTLSANGRVAMLSLDLTDNAMNLPAGATDAVVAAADHAADAGLTVLPGSELTQTTEAPFGGADVAGLVIAAIVLFLTLGSLRVAGMPLLTAIVGVITGVGGAYALSGIIPMTSITPILALMIGLAVGIDYALFITNRARRLVLEKGLAAHEAVARAVGTAGSAVFFAGLTVVVSLTGLSIVGIQFLTTMALIAAGTVVVAVLVALTLLPAVLGFVGERIVTPRQRAARAGSSADAAAPKGPAVRWATGVARHRGLVTAGVVVVLAALAVPVTRLDLNLPTAGTANTDTVERQSYDAITAGFGEGFNAPLLVVAHDDDTALSPATITRVKQDVAALDGVASVMPGASSPNGRTVTFTVVPTHGPDAASTRDLVHDLRAPALADAAGVDIGVTGETAINIDMSKVLADALVPYLAVIVVISLIILMLVFRSVFVPVTATLGFVLTIGASLGATTAIFQWGWGTGFLGFDTAGPILSFLPIIVTGILYGLAMDYQVFLVSSMRESHVHGHPGVAGVVDGFRGASRVVVAAGIIMISVFSGFIFGDDAMIKQIGFALAFGILVDAFVVRMTLIPAVMALAGEKAWWLPRWLDKILPNLDVEGDKLVRRLEAEAAAEAAQREQVGASA